MSMSMLQHNEYEAAVGYLAKKKLSSSANKASPSVIVTLLDLELDMCWIPHHTCLVVTTMVLYLLLRHLGLSDASLRPWISFVIHPSGWDRPKSSFFVAQDNCCVVL